MRRSFLFAFLFSLLLLSNARQLSRDTRDDDIASLDTMTMPYRRLGRLGRLSKEGLVDFLASTGGLAFLAWNYGMLWQQSILEHQYRRSQLCHHANTEKFENEVLDPKKERFRTCVCNRYMPFLHCLAIGAQLLRDDGYINEDTSEREIQEEMVDVEQNDAENENDKGQTCIPYWYSKSGSLFYGGHCKIPIAKILEIKIEDHVSVGAKKFRYLDFTKCAICEGTNGAHCSPICKNNIEDVASLIENGYAMVNSTACINLGRVGKVLRFMFGQHLCSDSGLKLYVHQRMVRLSRNMGMGSIRWLTDIEYKFQDGPDCTCRLDLFRCTRHCSMKAEDVIGVVGIEWDFFFGAGRYKKPLNKRTECYSELRRDPEDCSAQI